MISNKPYKRIFRSIHSWLILLILLGLFSCQINETPRQLKIAISKAVPEKSYQYYLKWIKSVDSTIICVDMYHAGFDSALKILHECDGLLLTGGEDVDPNYYGRKLDSIKCDLPNTYRDSLDMLLIEKALEQKIPIMGICRGLQILNVYFGGSLIFDIPSDFDTIVKHRYPKYKPSRHDVVINDGSLLHEITGVIKGNTNSNHHQGIEKLAPLLDGVAKTKDGLIEAIELKDNTGEPFLLGVQWHPEHMDYDNPLSGNIARRFLSEVKSRK